MIGKRIIALCLALSSIANNINADTTNPLDVGKYRLSVDIPVYASVDLKIVKIPGIESKFGPIILLEKFDDATSVLKVCSMGQVDMAGTKITYEEVADAYNNVQDPQLNTTYLIDIPSMKAIGEVSGFTVDISSKTKLSLDLIFVRNEDGSFSAHGTERTNLDYSEVIVTPKPLSYMRVKAQSTMEKDPSKHKFSIEKISDNASCLDFK